MIKPTESHKIWLYVLTHGETSNLEIAQSLNLPVKFVSNRTKQWVNTNFMTAAKMPIGKGLLRDRAAMTVKIVGSNKIINVTHRQYQDALLKGDS
jgi:hypothetical protein